MPTVVALQAGNVHSGAFDPFAEVIDAAHERGAWVHVDGAFGLWAAASSTYRHLVRGLDRADSWTTDAHKTLNVPYDSGLAIVRDPDALRASMGMHGDYLIHDESGGALRQGARDLAPGPGLPGLGGPARPRSVRRRGAGRSAVRSRDRLRRGLGESPGATVVNDVVFTQVCATFGSDERTDEVVRLLLEDGEAWMSGSTWRGQKILRISVSNWSTTADDVDRSLAAVRRAVAAL